MPPHLHYVEPYFGGGSVLFAKDPEGVSEVVNDINRELTNFWYMLQDRWACQQFQRIVELTPFSEVEYKKACEYENTHGDMVEAAVKFFVRCRQSLAGRMDTFATLSRTRTRRGMNEQASAWLTAIEGLPAVHTRLKRVVILNRGALEVIRQQDGKDTLFYLDPPYLPETRESKDVYDHEMSVDQHAELLETISSIQGKFMLSGYKSRLYSEYASLFNWKLHEFDLPNNAAGGETKQRMTECLWTNYNPEPTG